jgi:outer membrane protein assembly factor BamB
MTNGGRWIAALMVVGTACGGASETAGPGGGGGAPPARPVRSEAPLPATGAEREDPSCRSADPSSVALLPREHSRPVENLGAAWRVNVDNPLTRGTFALRTHGAVVVVDARGRLADNLLLDPANGQPSTLPQVDGLTAELWLGPAGPLLRSARHMADDRTLIVSEGVTWAERWRVRLAADTAVGELVGAALAGGRVIAVFDGHQVARPRLIAFDAATGREAWRSELRGHPKGALGDDPRIYVRMDDGVIVAHEVATGRELWAQPGPVVPWLGNDTARILAADAGRIAIAGDDRQPPMVRDGCTGEPVLTLAQGVRARAIALRGDVLYVAGDLPRPDPPGPPVLHVEGPPRDPHVVAIDVPSGRELWRWSPGSWVPWMALDDDVVYACAGYSLVALDRAAGRERWRWGVPASCDGAVTLARQPNAAATLVVKTPEGVAGLARGSEPVPAEEATVTGSIRVGGRGRAGVRVHVAGTEVVTDASGAYTATISTRGTITIDPDEVNLSAPAGRCYMQEGGPAVVPLTGARTYRAPPMQLRLLGIRDCARGQRS